MSHVLQIVMYNFPFSIKDLCQFKCIDKQSLSMSNESIKLKKIDRKKEEYFIKKISQDVCNICNKRKTQHIYPFYKVPSCYYCNAKNQCLYKVAKLKYNLSDNDLDSIDYYYKKGIKYLSLIQVQEKAILKNEKIPDMHTSFAKLKRIKKVEHLQLKYKDVPINISSQLTEQYIHNGNEGIKKLDIMHKKCKNLIELLNQHSISMIFFDFKKFIELNETFDASEIKKRIADCNKLLLNDEKRKYITYMESSIARKNNLLNILEREGFENILDIIGSNICRSYILGYIKSETNILLENIKHQNNVIKDLKSIFEG